MRADVLPTRQGVFERDDELATAGHEQVVYCRDAATGLRAIISIHSTARGPALGGTRFYPYRDESEALNDALRLSQGMTFKAAAANMPLGGGKAVIIGDPGIAKSPDLLRAYGRFIDRLGGCYVTAADVGTTADDLDVIGEVTKHVVGQNTARGGSGESGLSTATGVFHAMRAAAEHLWGADGLRGRTVGIEGVGKVGRYLVSMLVGEGASVVVADPSDRAVQAVQLEQEGKLAVAASVIDADIDVYAPCALGGTLSAESVASIRASVVCGAANNQLLTSDVASILTARGIVWVPDYVANAGGLIQVGSELEGRSREDVLAEVARIGVTTADILAVAASSGVSTGDVADRVVRERLSGDASRDGVLW